MFFKDNDFQLRSEDKLMLCCARTQINEEIKKKIVSLASKHLDWEYLINMASRHRLRPLLYVNLNSICPEKVPEEVLGNLKSYYLANAQKNLMMTSELVKIIEILESNDIKAIPYKGPVLADSAYGNIALREFSDLDIFIDRKYIFKVHEVLIENGYFTPDINKILDNNYLKSQKNLVFIDKDCGIILEIHWKISGNFFSFPLNPESVLGHHNHIISINGNKIKSFSKENMILVLSIHAAGHQWSRLLWVCDIAELIKNNDLNWEKIAKNACQLGIERVLYTNLILVSEIFEVEIPEKIVYNIQKDKFIPLISKKIKKTFFSINPYYPTIINSLKFHINIRDNLKLGINDVIKYATVPSIEELQKLKLSNKLYPIYFLFRPFHLIKKYK